MSEPLITCVMPTMNRPRYARHAIDLFMAQEWPNKELIILDDSEKDKQLDYIWDRRIKHVRLMDRMSLAEKHDIGNAMAQGEYIAYWDDDDWFRSDRLSIQMQSIERGNSMCGFHWDYLLFASTGKWSKVTPKDERLVNWLGNATAASPPGLHFHDGTAMYSRIVMRDILRHGRGLVAEKQSFIVEVALRGYKYECLKNDGVFVYVRHTTNYWRPESHGRTFTEVGRPDWFQDQELSFYRECAP